MLSRRALLIAAAGAAALAGCAPTRAPRGSAAPTPPVSPAVDVTTHAYGTDPFQVCDLYVPNDADGRTVVLIHGGYWQAGFDRSLEADVADDLVARGFIVWNLDYRGVGGGGGYPSTFDDVGAGLDLLADVGPAFGVDLQRVVLVGHSAGGHLALWGAGRHRLPGDAPGAAPRLRPVAAVSQAGVNDLVAAHRDALGGNAVGSLLGIDLSDPVSHELAARTSPPAMLPFGIPQLVITGDADSVVPMSQSESYAEAARAAGDTVTLELVPGEGHDAPLQPTSECWNRTRAWLAALE